MIYFSIYIIFHFISAYYLYEVLNGSKTGGIKTSELLKKEYKMPLYF